ncbi:MAG: flagellar hook-length control protein FliK [Idiomarina sp.]|nr:flagellar hook-length control protein FliK [Idiomarina sp.]
MDKLSAAETRTLLRQLLQLPPAQLTAAQPTARAASEVIQIQVPPALRQILAQATPPSQALQSLMQLREQADLPAPLRSLIERVIDRAQGPSVNAVTPALVSQWFGMNPAAALTSGRVSMDAGWLQQALPMLLLLLRPSTANGRAPSTPLAQAIGQLLGNPTMNASLLQTLRDLQGALQNVRLSQIVFADSAGRQEPDYYLTLPWRLGDDIHPLELLLKRRRRDAENEESEELWVLTMRLMIERIGPVLARVRWDGSEAQVMIYTDNDAASRWLSGHVNRLEQQLRDQGVVISELEVQTGRIPASLAPDPNQLIRVRV